jgi:hypothetical protein
MEITQLNIDSLISQLCVKSVDEPKLKSLIDELKTQFEKIEFNLKNEEYFIKEHCNEIRRQVQLAKEVKIQNLENLSNELEQLAISQNNESTRKDIIKASSDQKIQKLEETSEKIMEKIDGYEKESLDIIFKKANNNKQEIIQKINKIKQDVQNATSLNQLRECLSKIAIEKENLVSSLLNDKLLYFDQSKISTELGEFSWVNLARKSDFNLRNINLMHHFNKYKLNKCIPHCNNCGCNTEADCDCTKFKHIDWEINFLSNGYLLLFGAGRTTVNGTDYILGTPSEGDTNIILITYDLKNDACIKSKVISKHTYFERFSFKSVSDKMCFFLEDMAEQQDSYLVLDSNLETVIEKKETNDHNNTDKQLIGANDSFLFLSEDRRGYTGNQLDARLTTNSLIIYNWSIEKLIDINLAEMNYPALPLYNHCRLDNFICQHGKYYFGRLSSQELFEREWTKDKSKHLK